MKIKIFLLILLCVHVTPTSVFAQGIIAEKTDKRNSVKEVELTDWSYSKEVCFNFMPLISTLVPFNIGEKDNGLVGIKTKFYGAKTAFRISFGANIDGAQNLNFFHLGLGYENRYPIFGKFTYTSGWEGIIETVVNINGNSGTRDNLILGISKFYGLEYNINDKFFIGTESQLVMAIGLPSVIQIKFKPPVAIFVNVRFPKK